MKSIILNDTKISYSDTTSLEKTSSITILCIHGNSLSSKFYQKQLSSEILVQYRVVALDLPGHGNSEKVSAESYSFPFFVKVLEDFIHALDLKNILLVGHSLGGHLATSLLNTNVRERISGVFIFGAPPVSSPADFAKAIHPNEAASGFFKEELTSQEVTLMNRCLYTEDFIIPQELDSIIELADPKLRGGIAQSVMNNEMFDEIKILKESNKHFRILLCAQDVLINGEYILDLCKHNNWHDCLIIDEKGGHTPQVETPDQFNSSIAQSAAMIENTKLTDDQFIQEV